MKKSSTKPRSRLCACGCGRRFAPTRPWHRFKSDICRTNWGNARRREAQDLLVKRIAELEKKLGIKPVAPGKGA